MKFIAEEKVFRRKMKYGEILSERVIITVLLQLQFYEMFLKILAGK